MTLQEAALAVPKCELHLHLDGSLSPAFIARRAAARGVALPADVTAEGEGLREYVHKMKAEQVRQGHKAAPGQNWDVFEFCNNFLQTHEELRDATVELLDRLHAENVKICEIRFCPPLHTREGLSERAAVLAVAEGLQSARATHGVLGGVILCGLRSHTPEQSLRVAALSADLMEETGGVVLGFDIAGDEGSYPLSDHVAALRLAHERGACVTAHAGEWPVDEQSSASLDNLKLALTSGLVSRIGHGIQIVKDMKFFEEFMRSSSSAVCFECCLTANVGWKVPSYELHPIKQMIRSGLKVTLNCDNTLLSGSAERCATPSGEIVRFIRDVGMSRDDLFGVLLNAATSSF
ncbi:unnamed protein product, partial [Ectocarpus fasciculatus]